MQQILSPEGSVPNGNNPKVGKYVEAGDYEVYGEGDLFVVLHVGLLRSTCEMHRFIESLSTNNQIIVISTGHHSKCRAWGFSRKF